VEQIPAAAAANQIAENVKNEKKKPNYNKLTVIYLVIFHLEKCEHSEVLVILHWVMKVGGWADFVVMRMRKCMPSVDRYLSKITVF
jgi:hypothetical protein